MNKDPIIEVLHPWGGPGIVYAWKLQPVVNETPG